MARTINHNDGLPFWLLTPTMALFTGLVVAGGYFLFGQPITAFIMGAPACFDTRFATSKVGTGSLSKEASDELLKDFGESTAETIAMETASSDCTAEKCDFSARERYVRSLEHYLWKRANKFGALTEAAGQSAWADGWAYYDTAPHHAVVDGVKERLKTGVLHMDDIDEHTDLLSMLVYTDAPEKPCSPR